MKTVETMCLINFSSTCALLRFQSDDVSLSSRSPEVVIFDAGGHLSMEYDHITAVASRKPGRLVNIEKNVDCERMDLGDWIRH